MLLRMLRRVPLRLSATEMLESIQERIAPHWKPTVKVWSGKRTMVVVLRSTEPTTRELYEQKNPASS